MFIQKEKAMGKSKKEKNRKNSNPMDRSKIKARISACMIVKNEQEMLPRCLESIKDLIDELVIVDTGSTDKTVEIAQSFGAKVYHHPWENDFSKHRNQSISYATGEWIFIIDADEELVKDDIEIVRTAVDGAAHDVTQILMRILDFNRDLNMVTNETYSIRLFRNHIGIHYEGIVHNALIIPWGNYVITPARIVHCGYHLSPQKMDEKFQRRIDLLNRQLEQDPDNIATLFYLANAWFERDCHRSLEYGYRVVRQLHNLEDFPPVLLNIFYTIGACHMRSEDYEAAIEVCKSAIEYQAHNVDVLYILCDAHLRLGRYEEGIRFGEKYLEAVQQYKKDMLKMKDLWVHKGGEEHDVLIGIGLGYLARGDDQKARQCIEKAAKIRRLSLDTWKRILEYIDLFFSDKERHIKLYYLEKALQDYPEDIDLLKLAYAVYRERKETHKAISYLRALQRISDGIGWKIKEAEIQIEDRNYADALRILEKLYADHPHDWRINLLLFRICIAVGKIEDSVTYMNIALKSLEINVKESIESHEHYSGILDRISHILEEKGEKVYARTIQEGRKDLLRLFLVAA
ncbi:MAG TPA: glycosyltransferase [Deltaproteobacteria bacterium]|nr:glycosyltransferase [Deltaproteobacteria bacterium]